MQCTNDVQVKSIFWKRIFRLLFWISYFFRGESLIHSDAYCHAWQTIDYVFTAAIIWCTAFLTIERYILIFHSSFLRTKQQKNLLHFLPLIMIIAYISIFYILTNSLVRCDAEFNYNSLLCGQNCIDKIDGLSQFNWLFNIILPVFVIIFGSLFLLVRVLWTRREMQQNLRNWSKNSRMIIQLLSVSIVYTIVWMPLSVLSLISTFRKKSVSQDAENFFYFCVYLCEMLVPVIGLISWPELTRRIRSHFRTNSVTSLSLGIYSTN